MLGQNQGLSDTNYRYNVHSDKIIPEADKAYFLKVDYCTREASLDEYVGVRKEITKKHWRPVSSNSKCANPSCKKLFSVLFDRPHHCRKCGEVFCNACTQFKRRLNPLAHFDPDGQLCKVCKTCFEEGVFTDGQVRIHTSDFIRLRSMLRSREGASNLQSVSIWRSPVNFTKECQRLLDGFSQRVGKSEVVKTFQEVKSLMAVPDWLKSNEWIHGNLMTRCRVCIEPFGLLRMKQFCVICGVAVCKSCSSKDLLLYIPDKTSSNNGLKTVKMAVIRIIGCPEVEPEISLHLRVCPTCKERLISQQVGEVEEEEQEVDLSHDFMETLSKLHQRFDQAEQAVKQQLPKYVNVIESLEDASTRVPGKGNMKLLAKAQEDLADALANHVSLVQKLKKLSPFTATQTSLLKTYIKAKCEFYLDNMSSFRLVKSKLSHSVPADSLEFIQRTMDKNAIISTHLALRQLVYELLYLSQYLNVDDRLPAFLINVEQEIEAEVRKCLTRDGENVEEHMEVVKGMTQTAIKEHKLIRISKTAMKKERRKDLLNIVLSRTDDILTQIVNQLQLASANRSFQAGKKSLDNGLEELKCFAELDKLAETEVGEFVVVNGKE